jgi:hypothetical protein
VKRIGGGAPTDTTPTPSCAGMRIGGSALDGCACDADAAGDERVMTHDDGMRGGGLKRGGVS